MSLDLAIELFRLVINFEEYKEGLREVLTRCHTKEDLDRAKIVIDEEKERLMNTNPEFKAVMDQRAAEVKRQSDYDRAMHDARMSEAKSEASRARSEAMAKAQAGMRDVDDFVARTRVRKAPVEDLENKNDLYCPICQERDTSNNIVNNEKTCMKCMHRLVSKSDLKDYPRRYRRAWKRK